MSTLDFTITRTDNPTPDERREEILKDPAFGKIFSDHMAIVDWTADEGWHDARIVPFGPFELSPATCVLHYGQSIFEGLKAFRHEDGSVSAFRPESNARRLNNSARRLAMPELPEELFLKAVSTLVDVDRDWVPAAGGEASLYIRPLMFGMQETLGVGAADRYRFVVMTSPSGAYFTGGVSPVSVWLSEDFVRAAPGGTGEAKCAGNYAASLLAQQQAAEKGCDQVVWLDAIERRYVEEMGGMNLMFVYGSEDSDEGVTLVTPELSGSLLPGITRDSLLTGAQELGYRTEERKISVDEWRDDVASGRMTEALACGTAAVLTPVGTVKSEGGEFTINGNEPGEVTMKLRERLTGIQQGRVEDAHGWNTTLSAAR